ncbi:Alpha/beta hydrolase family protein [Stieleria maiorica]|uniref:Alpha/beta hydrolase family protein n=1 Tax=Stieleria maiorica TaxID=2795974 RepID=A0A5B9MRI1_9BACT|nr:lysophospholipase [Stieleria maiorica]QEG02677.1 Alpha/beta hydrolase family protein [Stieleria maiorica]
MIRSFRRHLLDRFVLRPSRNELVYAPKERVLVTVDRMTDEYFVEYRRARGDGTCGELSPDHQPIDLLILKFPGTAGRAERASDWPCRQLPESTVKICTWNAPGYGASSGRATLANIARRASRFWSLVTSGLPAQRPRIWLIGNSLGCATATYLASRPEVQIEGLILRNPPPLIQTVKRVARQYPLGHLTDAIAESVPPEMNLSLTAPGAQVPTVMLQSERDQLVPPALQMEVFDALPGPKRLVILEGLDHDGITTDQHEREIDQAVHWLWRRSLAFRDRPA